MELALGIICPNVDYLSVFKVSTSATSRRSGTTVSAGTSLSLSALASNIGGRTAQVLLSVIPIIENVSREIGVPNPLASAILGSLLGGVNRQCLHTTSVFLLDISFHVTEYLNCAFNYQVYGCFMAKCQRFQSCGCCSGTRYVRRSSLWVIRSQSWLSTYLAFLFFTDYNFGGVADPNPTAYMKSICSMSRAFYLDFPLIPPLDLPRVQNDTSLSNVPMVFGEWSIATNFDAVSINWLLVDVICF